MDIFSFVAAHRHQLQGSPVPSLNFGYLALLSIAEDIAYWGVDAPGRVVMPNYAFANKK